jgi:hypothetical protein
MGHCLHIWGLDALFTFSILPELGLMLCPLPCVFPSSEFPLTFLISVRKGKAEPAGAVRFGQ